MSSEYYDVENDFEKPISDIVSMISRLKRHQVLFGDSNKFIHNIYQVCDIAIDGVLNKFEFNDKQFIKESIFHSAICLSYTTNDNEHIYHSNLSGDKYFIVRNNGKIEWVDES